MMSSRLIGAMVGAVLSLVQVAHASDCDQFKYPSVGYIARSNLYSIAPRDVQTTLRQFEASGMRLIITSPNSFANQTIQRNINPQMGVFMASIRAEGIGFRGESFNPDSYKSVLMIVKAAFKDSRLVQILPTSPQTRDMVEACLDLNDLEKNVNLLKILPSTKNLGGGAVKALQ